MRHRTRQLAALLGATGMLGGAHGAEISVLGLFSGKALLVIDGAAPKTYSAGDKLADGVTLAAADSSGATIDDHGKRSVLMPGQYVGSNASGGQGSVTLPADSMGHFIANGQINGASVRMMVDTGASLVAIPGSEALRIGLDYRKGSMVRVNTANGYSVGYRVKIDKIRIGDLEVFQVDAIVQETGLSFILLGNSFLNRCDMQRNAQQLKLTKRF
jgi:aspartyl protease family protein